jgi:hypothetical protein
MSNECSKAEGRRQKAEAKIAILGFPQVKHLFKTGEEPPKGGKGLSSPQVSKPSALCPRASAFLQGDCKRPRGNEN